MSGERKVRDFMPLRSAVLTVSDSRTEASDEAGKLLSDALVQAGHALAERRLCGHDRYRLRAVVSEWIADPGIDVVLVNGGTGLMARNETPEAIAPLLDRVIEGFGELFRWLSYDDVASSTLASRALAGIANDTLVFCVPGSPRACRLAWEKIIEPQLDCRHRPCNLAELLGRAREGGGKPASLRRAG